MDWKTELEKNLEQIRLALSLNLQRVLEKKKKLDAKRPLSAGILQRIKEDLNIEWSYNSNSIEGNTLNLNETRMVLQEGMTVKGKSLREHLEITNHHEAIEYIEALSKDHKKINEKSLLKIHEIVMSKIEKEHAGRYRNGMVRIVGANFSPPNPLKIDDLMLDYFNFVNQNPLQLDAVEMATVMHHRFVWIHPFFDGNGRSVRLIMNLFLMQQGYPPAIILRNDRKKYYEALNRANHNDYTSLMLLVMQAIERSLDIYLMAYPDGYEYKSIQQIVEEEHLPYGQEYLSLLARRGKIDAYKEGRNWYTSKESVSEYIEKRQRIRKLRV